MRKISLPFLCCLVFSGCVSTKQFKDLEKRHMDAAWQRDSLSRVAMQAQADLADAKNLIENQHKDLEKLKEDSLQKGTLLRDCTNKLNREKEQNKALEENYRRLLQGNEKETSRLMAELRDAQNKLHEKEDALSLLEKNLNEKAAKLAELEKILAEKDQDVKNLKTKVMDALKGFKDSGLSVEIKNGKVYVSMSEKLLFATGSAEVDKKGQEALKQLSKVLEKDTTITVMIEGHTDDVPLRGTGCNKDNWDLSVQRATSIIRIITQNSKVEPHRLIAAGRGEYHPLVPNTTPENKSRNRRTEIILTPRLNDLFRILDGN